MRRQTAVKGRNIRAISQAHTGGGIAVRIDSERMTINSPGTGGGHYPFMTEMIPQGVLHD
ncbi:hypothetical protein UP06_07500 [Bradyrhizobium sp. LTSP857]|nr:hypothetical protein UP06_07500 [Bradyrhizobium sp. LTSP857]